jgi:hypothetical protein
LEALGKLPSCVGAIAKSSDRGYHRKWKQTILLTTAGSDILSSAIAVTADPSIKFKASKAISFLKLGIFAVSIVFALLDRFIVGAIEVSIDTVLNIGRIFKAIASRLDFSPYGCQQGIVKVIPGAITVDSDRHRKQTVAKTNKYETADKSNREKGFEGKSNFHGPIPICSDLLYSKLLKLLFPFRRDKLKNGDGLWIGKG